MGFKGFAAIYLAIVISVSAFVIVAAPRLQTKNDIALSNHFSVQWMGFVPTYSSQYPEYYVCINNLATDPLTLQIALQIKNQENRSFYFRIEQNQTPPSGWSLFSYTIGLINKDETKTFTYSALRTKPASISQGKLTETISLVVKAYYDSLYTQFYSEDSFSVTFNFLDKTAGVWTTLYIDNFDDGTAHQWTGYSASGVSTDYYRSFQYSLKTSATTAGGTIEGWLKKSFDISGAFSEAFLIYAIRSSNWASSNGVQLDGVKYFEPDVAPSANTWYQVAIKLPTSKITEVKIYTFYLSGYGSCSSYIDDVYVVAK